RVNEAGESSDVIGVPDAARIPRDRPGRAYARTGHSELTAFQTAYVGAGTVHATHDEPVVVKPFPFDTRAKPAHAGVEAGASDLARRVDEAGDAAHQSGIGKPSSPWLPPLEPVLSLSSLAPTGDANVAALGLADEPQRQLQRQLTVDLEQEGSL